MQQQLTIIQRINRDFTYHPPTPEQVTRYQAITGALRSCALTILAKTPASPEQTLALRALQQARQWANAAIAVNEADQAEQIQPGELPEWVQNLMNAEHDQGREWLLVQHATAGQMPVPVFPAFENEHPMLNGPDDLPGVYPPENDHP